MYFLDKIVNLAEERINKYGAQYHTFGICGTINFLVAYLYELKLEESFNSFGLWLRVFAGIICIILLIYEKWPQNLRKFLPLYWYFTITMCLPAFVTFMVLKNNLSIGWLMNFNVAMMVLILLVDWLTFIIMNIIGIAIGCVLFYFSSYSITNFPSQENITLFLYIYACVAILGSIFSRNKEIYNQEKQETLKSLGAAIAHEMRTPLASIRLSVEAVKEALPKLVKTYQIAKSAKLDAPNIEDNINLVTELYDNTNLIITEASVTIDMLLANVRSDFSNLVMENLSMYNVIDEVLKKYPFSPKDKEIVQVIKSGDFHFEGNEVMITNILYNLLRNSFNYLQSRTKRKPEIKITIESDDKGNKLIFRDNGKGINKKSLGKIFDKFFSTYKYGTGLGLSYCKMAMEHMGGKISCASVEKEFTEFTMEFPKI